MGRITIDNLSNSLKEYLAGLGLSEEQVEGVVERISGDLDNLATEDKDSLVDALNELVGKDVEIQREIGDLGGLSTNAKGSLVDAINELFQNANNGKELIASAIGEPLNAEDTFSAMSNDINSLLATFKANMMNNGVTVESSDKFKSLIDKISTMVEEGSGKGVQIANGESTSISYSETADASLIISNLNFKPTIIIGVYSTWIILYSSDTYFYSYPEYILFAPGTGGGIGSIMYSYINNHTKFYVNNTGFCLPLVPNGYNAYPVTSTNVKWVAIGVGEEDTTLRDSLADILGDKGVDVTEEDDMASLITKVEGIEQGSRYPKWYTHPGNVISTDKQISVQCYYSSAIACGTNIYCMGGYSGPYGSYHTMNDCYNTVDNTITSKTPLPGQRARMALSSIDKFIYCMGGRDSAGNISVNHIYDTELNTFSDGTSTPFVGSTQNVSAVYNRKIHFIKSGSHSCYDPDLNAWTAKNPVTFSVTYAVVAGVIKDKIYILPHYYPTEYVREYDPALDTWTNKAAVSVNGTYGAGGVIDDRLYYAAAYEAYTNINYYDPMTDSFNAPMQFSSRQTSRAAATLNGCLYLFGGCRNNDSSYRTSVIDIYVR